MGFNKQSSNSFWWIFENKPKYTFSYSVIYKIFVNKTSIFNSLSSISKMKILTTKILQGNVQFLCSLKMLNILEHMGTYIKS